MEPFTQEELAQWARATYLPFNQSEIVAWAANPDRPKWEKGDQNLLLSLFIIQKDTAYYIADITHPSGGYRGPYSASEMPQELGQFVIRLQQSGIYSRNYETPDGKPRKKNAAEVLIDLSTRAKIITASLVAQRTHYNPVTGELVEAVCPRRDLGEGIFDQKIHDYLDVHNAPQLIDWMSVVRILEKPTAALAEIGPGGNGKFLKAAACASLWSSSATPIDAESVIGGGSFNGGLTLNPIILLDEGTPQRMSSKVFRSLIGNRSRTLKRKFLPDSVILGCPRLIIACNDISELEFADKLNDTSMAAVTVRFCIVHADDAPKKFLEGLPRGETESWLQEGRFARHILWLEKNHKVEYGSRFLVEGKSSRLHKALVTQNATDTLVALTHLLNQPRAEMIKRGELVIGDGKFLVNASAFQRLYNDIIGDEYRVPPRVRQVVKDLQNLGREERADSKRYYSVDTSLLLDTSDAYQIGQRDDLEKRITDRRLSEGGARAATAHVATTKSHLSSVPAASAVPAAATPEQK